MNPTVFRAWSIIFLIAFGVWGWSMYNGRITGEGKQFKFGLDLVGGSHLVYEADTAKLSGTEVEEAMSALRDVIERRTNLFGVSEPLVQVEKASSLSNATATERLIVELPGVTDLNEAIDIIGKTPQLEFKLVETPVGSSTEPAYTETGLTGRYLTRATLQFSGSQGQVGFANEPLVIVEFNEEGKELFAKITRENVGRLLAIFLDGGLISSPVIREEISGGNAVISGGFTVDDAKVLVTSTSAHYRSPST
jgi:preprotein translocase subunit SecD